MLAEALADFKKQHDIRATKTCVVGQWIEGLAEQDQKDAENLFFDDPISNHKLSIFLKTLGVDISAESIRKHRMKGCACLWMN